MNEMEQMQQRIEYLENVIKDLVQKDRYTFQRDIQLLDGRSIQVAVGTGTKIATLPTQKLGFWNATPVVQPSAISSPGGGVTVDTQARAAIDSILTALSDTGLIAS